jgi:hypothetical protein
VFVRARDAASSVFVCVFVAFGCGGASVDPLLPRAEAIKVGKDPPAPGAKELGSIDVAHGSGCGLIGDRGSYEGAIALARDRASILGGDYVELVKVTGPHLDPVCYDNRYVVHGIAFKLAVVPPTSSVPTASRAASAAPLGCDPPCSPGYACSASVCLAVCNPACAAGQTCRQDRTCGESLAQVFSGPPPATTRPSDPMSPDAAPADAANDGR